MESSDICRGTRKTKKKNSEYLFVLGRTNPKTEYLCVRLRNPQMIDVVEMKNSWVALSRVVLMMAEWRLREANWLIRDGIPAMKYYAESSKIIEIRCLMRLGFKVLRRWKLKFTLQSSSLNYEKVFCLMEL